MRHAVIALSEILMLSAGWLSCAHPSPAARETNCAALHLVAVGPLPVSEAVTSRSGATEINPIPVDLLLRNECAEDISAFVVAFPADPESRLPETVKLQYDFALQDEDGNPGSVKSSTSFSRRESVRVPAPALSSAYVDAVVFTGGSAAGNVVEIRSILATRRSLLDGYRRAKAIPFFGDAAHCASSPTPVPETAPSASVGDSAVRLFNRNIANFVRHGNPAEWERYYEGKRKWLQRQIDQLHSAIAATPGNLDN